MLQNLKIRNFKALRSVDVELANLNLLTGLNGSGKSSLIQVLLLLRQSKELVSAGKINLNGEMTNIGTFQEVICRQALREAENQRYAGHSGNSTIIQIDLETEQQSLNVKSTVNHNSNAADVGAHLKLNIKNKQNALQQKQSLNIQAGHHNATQSIYAFENKLKEWSLFNNKFQYLHTERLFLKDDAYKPDVSEVIGKRMLGNRGEHTAFYLLTYGIDKKVEYPTLRHPKAKSDYLIDQVNAWLSEISPDVYVKVELNKEGEVEVNFGYKGELYKPKNVGFGLSYVLPVIVTLLSAEPDKLIIIENPEAHIHPRGQAELGRLLAAAAQAGAQLIIETHSDHILNGIRVAVHEKITTPDKIRIYYFKQNPNQQEACMLSIVIDENAKLLQKKQDQTTAELPTGFLDEWVNAMSKLF
ncbi:MAG: AAA family ATPase [Bernardetiaceae bacterium]|nr:AAA family ATPase [Bernardetiaceae bacterium]